MEKLIHTYNCPLGLSFDMGTDLNKPPIWKMHTIDWFNNKFKSYHPDKETLILIVRNYKEVLPRHYGWLNVSMLQNKDHQQKHYFINLQIYENWNPTNRLLIYYEDLIMYPEKTLRTLLTFLGEKEDLVKTFMNDYKKHKELSLKIYAECNGKPVTLGNQTIHHSAKMSISQRKSIDAFVQKTYPVLWDKYLKKYAEKK